MGLKLNVDIDTALGQTKELYIRIESITVHRTFGRVTVAITAWKSKKDSDISKNSRGEKVQGLVGNKIVYYEIEDSLGQEVMIPSVISFDTTKPRRVVVPVFEDRESFEEVPYKDVDEEGNWITCYKTEKTVERVQIGEREEITQELDLRVEDNLLSWSYGQVKAKLAEIVPIGLIEDVEE